MRRSLIVAGLILSAAAFGAAADAPDGPHVAILAMKFDFTPETVTLKKDRPVVLEITSLDRIHGFAIPELGLRADVLPTETRLIRLVPRSAGRFTFRCDNFCGEGHEEMAGALVVEE